MADEEHWVIYNATLGALDTVWIGEVERGTDGSRRVYLEEPYDMVGPLDLDELETRGVVAFAACLVMSRQRWREDQAELRRQSWAKRREFSERMREAEGRFWQSRKRRWSGNADGAGSPSLRRDERGYREILDLPIEGALAAAEIKKAFRRLAKNEHPDTGGSHERFVRITEARDALLETVS